INDRWNYPPPIFDIESVEQQKERAHSAGGEPDATASAFVDSTATPVFAARDHGNLGCGRFRRGADLRRCERSYVPRASGNSSCSSGGSSQEPATKSPACRRAADATREALGCQRAATRDSDSATTAAANHGCQNATTSRDAAACTNCRGACAAKTARHHGA